jgi:hypothetical protein
MIFALCRNRAATLVVLITFGVICHAQMTPQDACQAELAKCQVVLGAVGAKEAEGFVHLAAVIAETGMPSPASKGAPIALYPAADSQGMHGLRAQRREGAARLHEASPCCAGSHALVVNSTSGGVQPADGAEYRGSNATGCAARLRECRAHGSARRRSSSPGEPLSPSLPSISTQVNR